MRCVAATEFAGHAHQLFVLGGALLGPVEAVLAVHVPHERLQRGSVAVSARLSGVVWVRGCVGRDLVLLERQPSEPGSEAPSPPGGLDPLQFVVQVAPSGPPPEGRCLGVRRLDGHDPQRGPRTDEQTGPAGLQRAAIIDCVQIARPARG